jgi:hypothetical protein
MVYLLLGLDLPAEVSGALVLTSKFSLFFFFLALERGEGNQSEIITPSINESIKLS